MPRPRVLVIGLDGATWDLIGPWMDAGKLPNLAGLVTNGTTSKLMSTVPPVSPAAWSSFMTGKNPGKHGIFDFTLRDFHNYGMRVAPRPSEPTLWGLLSAWQRQVCIMNVPQTYPPEAVNGIMVTGLGTPSQARFTHPAALEEILRRRHYRMATDRTPQKDAAADFIQDVLQVSEEVTDVAIHLLSQVDWDLGMVVLRLTDEIPHFFWHAMDVAHPAHPVAGDTGQRAVERAYRKADELVGKLASAAAGRETTLLVVSDHGFGPLHKDVYLNAWLEQGGFLKMRHHLPPQALAARVMQRLGLTRSQMGQTLGRWGMDRLRGALRDGLGKWGRVFPNDAQLRVGDLVDWSRTRAYSVGYIGQIYVNLAGRDPQGVVAPGAEYEQTLAELTDALMQMVDPEDGLPVVERVLRKEEVYSGRHLADAPDLLVQMRGFSYITRQAFEFGRTGQVFAPPPTQETGGHRPEGILLASGAGILPGQRLESARIEDMAPTILYLLGCPVPSDMDGRVLAEIIAGPAIGSQPVSYCDPPLEGHAAESLSADEEQRVMEHLRRLGYIG